MQPRTLTTLLTLMVLLVPFTSLAAETLPGDQRPPIMPYPASLTFKEGALRIGAETTVTTDNISAPRAHYIRAQVAQALGNLRDQKRIAATNQPVQVVFRAQKAADSLIPQLNQDESYQLRITEQGIELDAVTESGVLHGMQTLLQLFDVYGDTLPAMMIADQPRFPWRGLLIDSVRHFIPVDDIKRQIEGMAAAKLNVLHWHLTDDQGWRVESKTHPKLHQLASDGQYYTQEQITSLVEFAALRGIRVVPELDLPGHASAIAVAYPELMSAPGPYTMQRHWGVFEPLLDPSKPEVYAFIRALTEEFAALFPDPFLHIGGDEVNPLHWQQSERIQAYMARHQLSDTQSLHAHFNRKLEQILSSFDKRMMGWDEIFHPDLPRSILVQSWRGLDSLWQIANRGYQGLLSTGFYIDQPQPTAYHYRNDPLAQPPALPVADGPWQTWQFTLPRLKGSAVTGEFSVTEKKGNIVGYIRLNNQASRPFRQAQQIADLTRFELDTWMGPTRFEVNLTNPQKLTGRVLIGNSPYALSGRRIASEAAQTAAQQETAKRLSDKARENILGAEATLWSELVAPHNLDLRLWPRVFAIAERLWSPASVNDSRFMYQRLARMHHYAQHQVSLRHVEQQQRGFASLVGESADPHPLMVFSEAVEQAQYYTRHHLKYQAGEYHQHAPLDRFVDFLPAESLTLVKLNQAIAALPQDPQRMKDIDAILTKWQHALPELQHIVASSPKLAELRPVITDLKQLLDVSTLISQQCGKQTLSAQRQNLRLQLWHLARVRKQELVLSSALAIEALLEACTAAGPVSLAH
ncbi:beta-N-acetylhexosaminidase [Lacimicrobium sp. SS2-24]|uniref:beta-N-acetylhexosaminidase n=1 Tax=Lacimicrobium sp. SS2-24 TaxID=2005569 RepID=UPI00143C4CF6|nr:beta-N-acetylhexosaminidase [Lacimicrobium sp. SS2-24]